MKNAGDKTGYQDSYSILESCSSFEQYLIKFAIAGIDEKFCYTREQFDSIRGLYEKYFSKLKK